jgi:HSP20 family molecular chaperone IbpA
VNIKKHYNCTAKMKLSLVTLALSASAVSAYNVGGFDTFGRPYYASTRGSRFGRGRAFPNGCAPPGGRESADRAFEDLRKELKNDRFRRPNPGPPGFETNEETIRQQEEFVNRAFGLASDVAKGFASSPQEVKEADEVIRQQRKWVDRAFGFARDVSSGGTYSSVRAEVLQDDDEAFQVALDVPGVKAGDIEVTVEGTKDENLVVRGKRNFGDEEARKFSKSISLNSRSNTDQMSADLENGVLLVTVPRVMIEKTESVQKIAVNMVSDESVASSEEANSFPFELELDVPGVSASNIDITIEGDRGKTLTITAVRELGKDSEGNPRKKETSKSYNVDDDIVDTSKIVANLSNGVLKVSAPAHAKKTEETVRKISVNQSSRSPAEASQSVDIDDGKKDDRSLGEEEAS